MSKQILILLCCFILSTCKQTDDHRKKTVPDDSSITIEAINLPIDLTTHNIDQAVKHYICYAMDDKPSIKIWIAFAENNHAFKIKYKGQQETLQLQFIKDEYMEGGPYPTIKEYYYELLDGQINGTYILTHSGVWDYVEYTGLDKKKTYHFTILHEENPYGKDSCFE